MDIVLTHGDVMERGKRYLGCHPAADLVLVDAYEINRNDYRACVRCSACWRMAYMEITYHEYCGLRFNPR